MYGFGGKQLIHSRPPIPLLTFPKVSPQSQQFGGFLRWWEGRDGDTRHTGCAPWVYSLAWGLCLLVPPTVGSMGSGGTQHPCLNQGLASGRGRGWGWQAVGGVSGGRAVWLLQAWGVGPRTPQPSVSADGPPGSQRGHQWDYRLQPWNTQPCYCLTRSCTSLPTETLI